MVWLLVLILALLAIGGGIALSKFLFLLLIVALVLALVGTFNRTTVYRGATRAAGRAAGDRPLAACSGVLRLIG